MPLTWDNLNPQEKEFYRWFHRKQCGLCAAGQCPIIDAQLTRRGGPGEPLFLPEAVYGEPFIVRGIQRCRKCVFFLAANPGGNGAPDEPGFPVLAYAGENSFQDYMTTRLEWFNREAHQNARQLGDCVTTAALWLLLRAQNHLNLPETLRVAIGSPLFAIAVQTGARDALVELNTVHCKSPGFPAMEQYPPCVEKTFTMLGSWRPRVLVAMGHHAWEWLSAACVGMPGFEPATGWGDTTEIHWAEGHRTRVVRCPHPSQQNINLRQYNLALAHRVDQAIHDLDAQSHAEDLAGAL